MAELADAIEDLWPKQRITVHPSFIVASSDTIPISTDAANPSVFTGLAAIGDLNGFELDVVTGSLKNVTGRTIGNIAGAIAFQPAYTGSGFNTTVLHLCSQKSTDGIAWTNIPGGLREMEMNTVDDTFKTVLSFTSNWLDGEYIRFVMYEDGTGDISLIPPSDTIAGQAATGRSLVWNLIEY